MTRPVPFPFRFLNNLNLVTHLAGSPVSSLYSMLLALRSWELRRVKIVDTMRRPRALVIKTAAFINNVSGIFTVQGIQQSVIR
jgi:hypothetical protein